MTPRKSPKQLRTIQFKIYLTEAEKQKIITSVKQEKHNSISDYARERLLKDRLSKRITVSAEYIRIFKTMDYNLTKIGTNLNQVAHKLNAYNTYMLTDEDGQTFKACFEHLKNCYVLLGQHLRKIN
ncbi:plasmid mobilization relaxosome protein MobC [Carboxylicivirga mesophila]|uniref:Plasmid mobilization relaxosome protein MobC n=1 Tax=Carboxylicivirga mesophila TaxID=1166478 RepID=A0ABS5K6V7_9BACT|nr:plasmid mobilization relaxosome protein MobC [Carboxylicivirga mesophila]MBS2210718.1 plasmid mobilization relaxosome protein MobC [Carboxylicivirga mesophila]